MAEGVAFAELVRAGTMELGDGYRAKLQELSGGGPVFLRAGALQADGFDWNGLDAFAADAPVDSKRGRPGDVVITTKGNSIGRVGRVPGDAPDFVYSPHLSYWRSLDHERLWPRYLYYWSRSRFFAAQLRNLAFGTDMAPYLSLRDQLQLRIVLPSKAEQEAISDVLGALDDKIASNQRTLRAADAMVRARYESLKGGRIPLGTIATNVRDQVDPKGVGPDTPYVGLEHVPRRTMWLQDLDTAAKVTSVKAAFRAGDVLFGKLRPYFHKVVAAPLDGVASTDILVVRAKQPELAGLVLAAASSDAAVAAATASSEGTRMPRSKWLDLAAVEIPWPGDDEARRFSSDVNEVAEWAASVAKESRMLAVTRDQLLPWLMSGKVHVKDAEKSLKGIV